MDFDFFCLPVIFGCSSSVDADVGQAFRLCPNCHNISVTSGRKRLWLEVCCVPVFPMSSSHVWICSICHWTVKVKDFDPQLPGMGPPPGAFYPPPGQYGPPGQNPPPGAYYSPPYPPQPAYHQGYPATGQQP